MLITDKIYTAIIIEIVVQVVILIAIVLGILLSRKGNSGKTDGSYVNTANYQNFNNQNTQQQYAQTGGQVTYCKKCANEYDASLWICPYCGTPR